MARHNIFANYDLDEQKAFIAQVLENEPPYKKIPFDMKWYRDFNNIAKLSINSYCEHCASEKVFTGDIDDVMHNTFSDDVFRSVGRVPNGTTSSNQDEYFADKSFFLNLELNCALCGETHYYSLLFTGDKVQKIGQYPSYASSEIKELVKYKNIISKYYTELTKSVSAYSQRMGVAAFTYLRRILEDLVDKRIADKDGKKFIDKLKEVEKTEQIIPDNLSAVKSQIYAILSKGVHEYDDEECLQLYLAVKYVITSLLDMELKKKEDEKKVAEAVKMIQNKLAGGQG